MIESIKCIESGYWQIQTHVGLFHIKRISDSERKFRVDNKGSYWVDAVWIVEHLKEEVYRGKLFGACKEWVAWNHQEVASKIFRKKWMEKANMLRQKEVPSDGLLRDNNRVKIIALRGGSRAAQAIIVDGKQKYVMSKQWVISGDGEEANAVLFKNPDYKTCLNWINSTNTDNGRSSNSIEEGIVENTPMEEVKTVGISRKCVENNRSVFDKFMKDGKRAWCRSLQSKNWYLVEPTFSDDRFVYVEDDNYAELRKYRADGFAIEFVALSCRKCVDDSSECDGTRFNTMTENEQFVYEPKYYRLKKREWRWEDEISEETPVLCRVFDDETDRQYFKLVISFSKTDHYPYFYEDNSRCTWKFAVPVNQIIKKDHVVKYES